ncbi:hypothetical protein RDABS01_036800, partial [Bienertia sinuspersici]
MQLQPEQHHADQQHVEQQHVVEQQPQYKAVGQQVVVEPQQHQRKKLEQAELRIKFPDRKRRGPTRGKKYGPRMWYSNSKEKIKINFMDELRRVVGEKASEFICDCRHWFQEYCPVDSWYVGKYDLPGKVTGADVTEALSFQCSMLYKHWRFRLKEQHFRNKPNTIDVGPWTWLVCEYWNNEKQKHINKVNTKNKLKQTETPANGARSIARIFHDLVSIKEVVGNQMLKQNYEALKRLHEKQMEKHGEDTLSVKYAYMEVFKHKSGYVKGLGLGARPPKKCRAEGDTREASLVSEIETLKASNEELKTSNEEPITSNDELKATISRINIEAFKREKKLRDNLMKMFEQM